MLITPPVSGQGIGHTESVILSVTHSSIRAEILGEGLILMGHWNPEFIFDRRCFSRHDSVQLSPRNIISYKRMVKRAKERGITENNKWVLEFDTDLDPLKIYRNYKRPLKKEMDEFSEKEKTLFLGEYGVCDTPEQLLNIYDFEKDHRKLFICFVAIDRVNQPRDGGWRYHKWGEYVGTQNPQSEYIYDDEHIDRVYTYHVYEMNI